MYIIQQLTDAPLQDMTLVLPDGSSFYMQMYYVDLQQGWFITNLTYNNFVLQGVRITVSPNMLNQFRNQIPFGICCASSANREPSLIQDFSSGNCSLYVLDAAEVAEYYSFLSTGSV